MVVDPGGANGKFARAGFAGTPAEVWPGNRTILGQIAADGADVMATDGIEVGRPSWRLPCGNHAATAAVRFCWDGETHQRKGLEPCIVSRARR
ncbi:hypothetical protein J2850_005590 [Azospirillum picis]|uniref:Uncharacterized protein n=1 Tax=Azospirillum picis TaxID=488438 RepID=A0ABU0MT61_9PROT|nr:hypothetical protein [Azospirillum picis]MDQ0536647.1 hypothetical protein [Azospirillum picis]